MTDYDDAFVEVLFEMLIANERHIERLERLLSSYMELASWHRRQFIPEAKPERRRRRR